MDNHNIKRIKSRNKASKVYKEVLKIYNYRCAVCDWCLPYQTPIGKQLQGGCDIHHITPFSKGGSETIGNLILLCPNHHKEADTGMLPIPDIYAKYHKSSYNSLAWCLDNFNKRIKQ